MKNFTDQLNGLFDRVRKTDGSHYTHEEVSEATGVNAGYISRLRSGKATNPSYKIIQAFATFFQVAPGVFFEEAPPPPPSPAESDIIKKITLRASQLDHQGIQALLGMLEYIDALKNQQGFASLTGSGSDEPQEDSF